ncbi:hypothetical protein C8R44DRAFT_754365 [Mycena epipterygia]|nr:hypothetical protein C8R44DRAFT_754365 [Mycena epipterygia]
MTADDPRFAPQLEQIILEFCAADRPAGIPRLMLIAQRVKECLPRFPRPAVPARESLAQRAINLVRCAAWGWGQKHTKHKHPFPFLGARVLVYPSQGITARLAAISRVKEEIGGAVMGEEGESDAYGIYIVQ